MITKVYYKVNSSLTSLQRPPWGQKKVAIVERFKRESTYGLSAKKKWPLKRSRKERWPFVAVRLYYNFRHPVARNDTLFFCKTPWTARAIIVLDGQLLQLRQFFL